ncbi:MAG: septal ring lytic transglycosylase RlpA family protein [Micavibrio sp.]|nr:septal ring lytic transglycosylase RlpA family protein [Micavibrio sp.]
MRFQKLSSLAMCILFLSACAEAQLATHVAKRGMSSQKGSYKVGNSYEVMGQRYQPVEKFAHIEKGKASWYGPNFHGKRTANGERFDKHALTAAHRTLQMPSIIRVTNLANNRSVILRVNDRGPFSKSRVLDVSEKAATVLGFKNQGTTNVQIEVLKAESQHVASLAKRGISTEGIEVAMNNGTWRPAGVARQPVTQVALRPDDRVAPTAVAITEPVALGSPTAPQAAQNHNAHQNAPNLHLASAASYNAPSVAAPVVGAGNYYVQAGAFSDMTRAENYARSLTSYGDARIVPANINGRTLYRVRVGPFEDRYAAASISQRLGDGRNTAIVIVD